MNALRAAQKHRVATTELDMPALRRPRQERFCQAYRENGGNARKAYVAAGYAARTYRPDLASPADACASRLLRSDKVKQRLQELAGMDVKRHQITVDSLLADLEADRALAHHEGQGSAAVQATLAKARLLGLLIDRKESGKPGDFDHLATVDDVIQAVRAELGDEAARTLAALAAPSPTNSGPDSVN